ncbi:MAG: hypothetical protein HYT80_06030 [Euryarchaeota archaeon]|nr:hypothetical protein [Euryarchaeota archaeon]
MSEEEEGQRVVLEGAVVYLHVVEKTAGGESYIHIDIDHPDLNDIIVPRESTYAGGKKGGLFVGLRMQQAQRAQEYAQARL